MSKHVWLRVLCIAGMTVACDSSPSPDAGPAETERAIRDDGILRLAAINLGLNANQPDVRERQDLYLSTKPGTDHSHLVDATEGFDLMCTNEMYTWSEEDSYVVMVEDLSSVFPYQLKGAASSDLSGCACDQEDWAAYVEPFRECVREDPQRDLLTCFNAPITQMGQGDEQWSPWRCTRCLTATVLKTFIDYTLPLEEQQALVDDMDFSTCQGEPVLAQCPNCEGKSGVAIHSKYPIVAEDRMTFPFSWSSTRGVLYAKIDHPSGPIHAFCSHIAESGTAKFRYPASRRSPAAKMRIFSISAGRWNTWTRRTFRPTRPRSSWATSMSVLTAASVTSRIFPTTLPRLPTRGTSRSFTKTRGPARSVPTTHSSWPKTRSGTIRPFPTRRPIS